MGLITGLIKRLLKLVFYIAVFAIAVVLIPNIPPYTKFSSIKLEPTKPRTGVLESNGLLNKAEQLYKGKLLGPEAFQIYNGELYTSLATGEIVKLTAGGHVTFVTKIGQPCSGLTYEHICGRPLGFVIDEKTKILYVADAYYGIWKVDLNTDKKQLLVSPRVEIEGKAPKIFNSITLDKNGNIYFTDSSTDFYLKDGVFVALSDPSGRLLYYNIAKNQSKVVLDNLWLANGVVASGDNQFVVVAESCRYRLLKYYIDGPHKGNAEIFISGLPGIPDNLRALPDGSGVLVGLYTMFNEDNPLIMKSMSETPHVRMFIARLFRLIELPFEYLNKVYPHFLFDEITHYIGHFKTISGLTPALSGLLQLDWNGNIVALYDNTDSTLGHVSDGIVYNGKIYTGSPNKQDFIGAVPAPPQLLKAFSKTVEPKEIPKAASKIQQTKPVQKEAKIEKREIKTEIPKPTEQHKTTEKQHEKKPTMEAPQKSQLTVEPPKPASNIEPKATSKPETKPTPKPHSQPSKIETKTNNKPETKPTPKPEIKTAPKLETKTMSKPETKTTPKPETKPTPKPETNATPKPETKPTAKPETKTTPKAETKPTPKPETKTTPKAETKPTPKPETKTTPPTPKPVTKSTTKPVTRSTSKPESKQTPDVKPTPKPEIKTSQAHKTESAQVPDRKKNLVQEDTPKIRAGVKSTTQEIPIKEEIPSDTAKPNKETLKVIKKDGPTEIPNPNL